MAALLQVTIVGILGALSQLAPAADGTGDRHTETSKSGGNPSDHEQPERTEDEFAAEQAREAAQERDRELSKYLHKRARALNATRYTGLALLGTGSAGVLGFGIATLFARNRATYEQFEDPVTRQRVREDYRKANFFLTGAIVSASVAIIGGSLVLVERNLDLYPRRLTFALEWRGTRGASLMSSVRF